MHFRGDNRGQMNALLQSLAISTFLTGVLLFATLGFFIVSFKLPRAASPSVLFISLVGLIYGSCEIALIYLGSLEFYEYTFQISRIQQLALSFYLMAIPLTMKALKGPAEPWELAPRFMLYFGVASTLILTLLAFLSPDLFKSLTLPVVNPEIPLVDLGRGLEGPLFHGRNALLTIYMLISLAWLSRRHRREPKDVESFAFLLGCASVIAMGLLDILQDTWGAKAKLFPELYFSRYLLGITLFAGLSMGGVVLALIRQARNYAQTSRELIKQTEEAVFLAFFDPLTGLPNRKSFLERLDESTRAGGRNSGQKALFLLDLDQLGQINDSLGAKSGDLALIETTRRIKDCIRSTDFLYRVGGDEFTIILSELGQPTDAAYVAQKIIQSINKPYILGAETVSLGISMGIALFPRDGKGTDELLRKADEALNEAKKDRNTFYFFSETFNREAYSKLALLTSLRESLVDHRDFDLYWQPIIRSSGEPVGAEALLRWRPRQGNFISPEVFIPLAEATGLINQIGAWVIKRAFWDLVRFKESGLEIYISVNLSVKQLRDPALLESISTLVQETGVSPGDIQWEITETALMDNPQGALTLLQSLVDRGFRMVLDDFGMGYSSLAYLRDLPIRSLKIDKSFIQRIDHTPRDSALVKTMVDLARGLDMKVVAEGVETQQQLDFLRLLDCHLIQGYYFSQPLCFDEFISFMKPQNLVT